jgi:beta-lactamase class A
MNSISRRTFVGMSVTGAATAIAGARVATAQTMPTTLPTTPPPDGLPYPDDTELAAVEQRFGRRLGVVAYDTHRRQVIAHRADERFPILSVSKTLIAAIVLMETSLKALADRLTWSGDDVVENSPMTSLTVRNGLTVAQLCEAAVTRSDNTAANVLMGSYGGPAAVTALARSLGDNVTRLDRFEPDLNTAIPGDERDTTTAQAISETYEHLILGNALPRRQRQLLTAWLLASQTSATRFGAGVPAEWRLADKTGAGAYATRNDVGVTWRPDGRPIVIAALSAGDRPDAEPRDAVLAEVAAVVTRRLGEQR